MSASIGGRSFVDHVGDGAGRGARRSTTRVAERGDFIQQAASAIGEIIVVAIAVMVI
jgi:hypothetical protein